MSNNPEFDRLRNDAQNVSVSQDEGWQERLDYLLRSIYRAGARAQLNHGYARQIDAAARLAWLSDQELLSADLDAVLRELDDLREKANALNGACGVTDSEIRSMIAEGFHTAFRKATDTPEAVVIYKLIKDMDPQDWGAVIDFVANPIIEWLRQAEAAVSKPGE